MKRVLLTVAVALLIPGILLAADPTMGVYFNGFLYKTPAPMTNFYGHVYICQDTYFVTAVEYALYTPSDPYHTQFIITNVTYPPQEVLHMGDPWLGHSITYYPPLTGYPTGCDLICSYTCMTLVDCHDMPYYQIQVGPHPDTGELRGTYSPNAEFFDITGLTSVLCVETDAQDSSWGAIKSMNR